MLTGIITLKNNLAKSTETEFIHTLRHSNYTNSINVYIVPKMTYKKIFITAVIYITLEIT